MPNSCNEFEVIADFGGATAIDVHGDVNVGRILRADRPDERWVIDFDGNPTQSPEQRFARQPLFEKLPGYSSPLQRVLRSRMRNRCSIRGLFERSSCSRSAASSSTLLRVLPHWKYVPGAALASLLGRTAANPSGNDHEGAR